MNDQDIQQLYEAGLTGYVPDPQADAAYEQWLEDTNHHRYASSAISDSHLEESGKGKLALPYLAALATYPNCLPGGRQERGSCVAWSTKNALMVSYCASLVYGDNPSGYSAPPISSEGCASGAFSTDVIYWYRRHGRDGWTCSSAAKVATEEAGLVPRANYPKHGIDLTHASPKNEGRWGSQTPPQDIEDWTSEHLCGDSTVCRSWEEARDLLANGYALSTCGMEAWESKRDANGFSPRSRGSWAHAMAVIGMDDRAEVRDKYGDGLLLVQNSWGSWNRGGDRVLGTDYTIPAGSFWARWGDFKNRYMVALSDIRGWPPRKLPDWGTGGIL